MLSNRSPMIGFGFVSKWVVCFLLLRLGTNCLVVLKPKRRTLPIEGAPKLNMVLVYFETPREARHNHASNHIKVLTFWNPSDREGLSEAGRSSRSRSSRSAKADPRKPGPVLSKSDLGGVERHLLGS